MNSNLTNAVDEELVTLPQYPGGVITQNTKYVVDKLTYRRRLMKFLTFKKRKFYVKEKHADGTWFDVPHLNGVDLRRLLMTLNEEAKRSNLLCNQPGFQLVPIFLPHCIKKGQANENPQHLPENEDIDLVVPPPSQPPIGPLFEAPIAPPYETINLEPELPATEPYSPSKSPNAQTPKTPSVREEQEDDEGIRFADNEDSEEENLDMDKDCYKAYADEVFEGLDEMMMVAYALNVQSHLNFPPLMEI